ncbi:glycosyltransferase family 2 protein [Piscinibacter sakaiensis]|uniref:glycosyltransferase family 2 protein n=1 Tax=Piscinibacter sakaiensis TaxID=1547922 RepID=UPI0026813344
MKVSVVICNFNHGKFVGESINSVLRQTLPAHQIIVVDDGSTDDSREIMSEFGSSVQPIFKVNGGQRSAYNAGYEAVRGQLVIFLDADDYLQPEALEEVVRCWRPQYAKLHFFLDIVDEESRPLGSRTPRVLSAGDFGMSARQFGYMHNSAPASGNVYSVEKIRPLFPLPVSDRGDRHGADFFLIYGSALLGSIGKIAASLGRYRVVGANRMEAVFFGNAARSSNEPVRQLAREAEFIDWVQARLQLDLSLDHRMLGASVSKLVIGGLGLAGELRGERLPTLLTELGRLARALAMDRDRAPLDKLAMFAWALIVAILPPSKLRIKVIRAGCNQASR